MPKSLKIGLKSDQTGLKSLKIGQKCIKIDKNEWKMCGLFVIFNQFLQFLHIVFFMIFNNFKRKLCKNFIEMGLKRRKMLKIYEKILITEWKLNSNLRKIVKNYQNLGKKNWWKFFKNAEKPRKNIKKWVKMNINKKVKMNINMKKMRNTDQNHEKM